MEELVVAIKQFQDAVDLFDAAAAASLAINATDLRCMTALHDRGPLLVADVSQALGLSKGATTTALDRLESAGYVKRRANSSDGRSFIVRLTARGMAKIVVIWEPMRVDGRKLMENYSERDLRLFVRFFIQAIDLQDQCRATLRVATEPEAKISRR